jgi:hypothetical protein
MYSELYKQKVLEYIVVVGVYSKSSTDLVAAGEQ